MAAPSAFFEAPLTPLFRLRSPESFRDGIFSAIERGEKIREVLYPAKLLENIGENVRRDLKFLDQGGFTPASTTLQIDGNVADVFVHKSAKISKFAVLDATNGPVVIDAEAVVGAFSLVCGPAYIGAKTRLDRCSLGNAVCGRDCRLGGEISDSIIGNFTNKHHEGFLGHSLVGDWVNLGALTTTSDLKNNYGEVRLTFQGEVFSTGTIKFGSIIGDYVKTAIGTMLGTGTVVDMGANLFGTSQRAGYIRPFVWGEAQNYDRAKFIADAERMMRRRGQVVSPELQRTVNAL